MNRRKFLAFFGVTVSSSALAQSNSIQSWAKNLTPSLPFKPVLGPMPLLTSQIEPSQQALRFKDYTIADDLILPEGYSHQVLGAWGDRLGDSRFGYNNDYLFFIETALNQGYLAKMALRMARRSVLRGRPPFLAAGSKGDINSHCASVRSVG